MTRTTRSAVVVCAIAAGIVPVTFASSRSTFSVPPDDTETRVQFVSNAPLEKITGVGHALKGSVELDPAQVKLTKGTIELDVASIRTNETLRDQHLRGPDWLDAAKYPKITFEIKKVAGVDALEPDKTVDLKVLGKLSMHGVTREELATAKARWTPGTGVRITAQFSINLANYKVSVPSLVRLKVSDNIELNVIVNVKSPAH